jgi:hypothetical protein
MSTDAAAATKEANNAGVGAGKSKHSHSTSQAQPAPRKVRFNVGRYLLSRVVAIITT